MLYKNVAIVDFKTERRLVASCTSEASAGSEHILPTWCFLGVVIKHFVQYLYPVFSVTKLQMIICHAQHSFVCRSTIGIDLLNTTMTILAVKLNTYSKIDEAIYTDLNPLVGLSGADPGFFFFLGALVSCSTSTPINHIVIFLQNTSCIRKLQVISGGRGCALPAPSP